jgi:hypothetical protein
MNLNQELHDEDHATICAHATIMSHADQGGMKDIREEQILEKAKQGEESGTFWSTPVKRSKRTEGSVDEDSNTRAQRLKAIKNHDARGTSESKSFLSFPNDKIKSTISSLGISVGINVDQGIDMNKEIEYNRLFEAPNIESANESQNITDEEFESDRQRHWARSQ